MQAFLEPLKELADYQEIVSSRRKKTGFLQIAGCVNSQKIHLAKALSDGFEYRVIVFSSEEKAKQAYEEWRVLEENVWFYPARDLLFIMQILGRSFELVKQRMEGIQAVLSGETGTVVTRLDGFMDLRTERSIVRKKYLRYKMTAFSNWMRWQRSFRL